MSLCSSVIYTSLPTLSLPDAVPIWAAVAHGAAMPALSTTPGLRLRLWRIDPRRRARHARRLARSRRRPHRRRRRQRLASAARAYRRCRRTRLRLRLAGRHPDARKHVRPARGEGPTLVGAVVFCLPAVPPPTADGVGAPCAITHSVAGV